LSLPRPRRARWCSGRPRRSSPMPRRPTSRGSRSAMRARRRELPEPAGARSGRVHRLSHGDAGR
jgi:hypothetical protein